MKKGEKLHNENKWRKCLGGAPMLEQMEEKGETRRRRMGNISIALPMVTIWLQCHEISIVYLMCFMVYECLSLPINTSDNCSTEFDISWSIIGSIREVTIDGIDLKNSEQWTVNSEQWTVNSDQ